MHASHQQDDVLQEEGDVMQQTQPTVGGPLGMSSLCAHPRTPAEAGAGPSGVETPGSANFVYEGHVFTGTYSNTCIGFG
jgi:hypothetical protein